MRRRRRMLGRVIVVAIVAIIIGVAIEHFSGLTKNVVRLLGFSGQSIEEVEQEAEEAGNKAAGETLNELDKQTDDEVAANSAIADEHESDTQHRHSESINAVRRAVDDLDRRLREDVRYRDSERAESVSSEDERIISDLDADLRERLRERATESSK